MEYRITCVCGHQFAVSEGQVTGTVVCPACGQKLVPDVKGRVGVPPTAEVPRSLPVEAMKRCPFCGEPILAIARKCKHCGEFLDRAMPAGGGTGSGSETVPSVPGPDEPVFALAVSQWDNFWKFLILLTVFTVVSVTMWWFEPLRQYALLAIPGGLAFLGLIGWYYYLAASHTRVIVRPTRVDTERGILSKKHDSLELFRITDVELKQNLMERILGIGTIYLQTNDASAQPQLVLYQIPKAKAVYSYLQTQIPIAAKARGAVYLEK